MLTLAEWIIRLTKGYIRHTGKKPDGLAKLKIKMDAAQKVKDQSKVIKGDFNPKEEWWKARPEKTVPEVSGIDTLLKSDFESMTKPKVKKDLPKSKINYVEMEKKFGFPLRGTESFDELVKIEKMGRDQYYNSLADRALSIRTRMSRRDQTGGTEIGYQEFNKLQKEMDEIGEFIERVQKEIPEDMASGGIARVGMAGGGALWKFIEGLFIKASNDIRLGRGKWKGLTQPQWIKQHDDLTKMLKKWEMGGKKRLPEGASEYLGMNDLQISKAIKDATKKVKKDVPEVSGIDDLLKSDFEAMTKPTKTLEGLKKEGTIDISDPEVADEFTRFMKESDPKGYKKLEQQIEFPTLEKMPKSSSKDDLSQEIKKGVEDVMKDTSDEGLKRSIETDNLKLEFPGISDEMIDNILTDTNPQRIAEVKQTMREALEMQQKGMGPDEIIKTFEDTSRKKNASGGIAGQLHMNQGGRIGYAQGTKKPGEGQYSPTRDKAWMQTMPQIDPRLRDLMREYKNRKGLAEILGV